MYEKKYGENEDENLATTENLYFCTKKHIGGTFNLRTVEFTLFPITDPFRFQYIAPQSETPTYSPR